MYKNTIVVNVKNGIHTRIAAMIVHKATEIKSRLNINLYIRKTDSFSSPLAVSMLALISLKIQEDELIEISCIEDSTSGRIAVIELSNFITKDLPLQNSSMTKIDDIIEENTIANEQIIQNLPIGIIVIDVNSYITTINDYALSLLKCELKDVIGRFVHDVLPGSELPTVVHARERQIGKIQNISDHIVVVNRTPIYSKNRVIGAIGVFQDISELIGMKELNERLKRILESSHDLICFVDEYRKISYINPAYEKQFSLISKNIIGRDLKDISPKGLRMKVFESKERIDNFFYTKDGIDILTTIEPIFIDDEFKGVISTSKSVNEIKDLVNRLEKSEEELNYYKDELRRHTMLNSCFEGIIGSSGSLREMLFIADKAAQSTSTVLIRGESGTGKELIAKAIHYSSVRKDKPFVRVNCAAIPENLLESELFGYEKGAFTGAVKNKPGKFTIADGGTIFLDEIGDVPLSMQVKLLRVLQEKEFESVGGIITQKPDVRIIAATNRNLEEMLINKSFREDLYYRLNVLSINLPPLRERKEDIPLLTEHFIRKVSKNLNKNINSIDKNALRHLQQYSWPGNIRELENIIERAINLCEDNMILPQDLPGYIKASSTVNDNLINLLNGELATFEDYEKEIIALAMEKYKSFNKAGKALGLTHRTISLKCEKYKIKVKGASS